MLLYPNKSSEVEAITAQLKELSLLYFEAVMGDYEISIRKEIKLKIIELHTELTMQKIISMGLDFCLQ